MDFASLIGKMSERKTVPIERNKPMIILKARAFPIIILFCFKKKYPR